MMKILLVEDERNFLLTLQDFLGGGEKYKLDSASCLSFARKKVSAVSYDVVILDNSLPDGKGLELIPEILKVNELCKIILITAYPDFRDAVRAIKLGAFDYVSKPVDLDELLLKLEQAGEFTRLQKVEQTKSYEKEKVAENFVGLGKDFDELNLMIDKASKSKATILITGETGTGKSLVAKEIHLRSSVSNQPFISVNCGALPESLIESELFGVERGAFTDARPRKGVFELADGGTLFLDEICEMPINLQVKLLSVLEEKRVRRLGGEVFYNFDLRIIAATNSNPEEAVTKGKLRSDLFYRLNVFRIHLKPLRERKQDIPILCEYFVRTIARGKHYVIPESELKKLIEYEFPGNVRELRNIIERSILLSENSILEPSKFISKTENRCDSNRQLTNLYDVEKAYILEVLKVMDNNLSRTARTLGISLSTLKRKLKSYGLR